MFGDTLVELAEKNDSIVGITAAMPSGTSMNKMARFPNRMFDVGISEGHAVTFAGGLAAAGKRPFTLRSFREFSVISFMMWLSRIFLSRSA